MEETRATPDGTRRLKRVLCALARDTEAARERSQYLDRRINEGAGGAAHHGCGTPTAELSSVYLTLIRINQSIGTITDVQPPFAKVSRDDVADDFVGIRAPERAGQDILLPAQHMGRL